MRGGDWGKMDEIVEIRLYMYLGGSRTHVVIICEKEKKLQQRLEHTKMTISKWDLDLHLAQPHFSDEAPTANNKNLDLC